MSLWVKSVPTRTQIQQPLTSQGFTGADEDKLGQLPETIGIVNYKILRSMQKMQHCNAASSSILGI
jgi:hypothetical protein